jgi:hypothetical protein
MSTVALGAKIATLTPAMAVGAPLLNELTQGASNLKDILPEGFVDKAKETFSNVMSSPAVEQAQDRIGDMVRGLRGGLLGKVNDMGSLGEMGGRMDGIVSDNIKFFNGLKTAEFGNIKKGFDQLRQNAPSLG